MKNIERKSLIGDESDSFFFVLNARIGGKILATDYLNFSDPKALEKLHGLSNIEIKMYLTNQGDRQSGFHTKGYIFKREEIYRIIVGSSNMTLSALTTNKEWNTKIVSTEQGEYAQEIITEFNDLWNSENTRSYNDFIDYYRTNYEIIKKQRKIAASKQITSLEAYRLKPNSMQVDFITNLRKLVDEGEERALLISATGARFILMTGRNTLKLQGFGPVFSYVHWMPGAGKRGIEVIDKGMPSIIS